MRRLQRVRRADIEMIKEDLFSFAFIKKSPFYGSYRGMRYRVGKEEDQLAACVYPEPYSYENTPEEEKQVRTFAFSPEGYEQAKDWLVEMYEMYGLADPDAEQKITGGSL